MKKIAILRGINVGGHRKLKMADLRELFSRIGFSDVSTYIQSGNVAFNSNAENSTVGRKIDNAIFEHFGYDVPVVVRSADELDAVVENNPFLVSNDDTSRLHVVFLKEEPVADNITHTESYDHSPDKFIIDGRHVYLYIEGAFHKTKLSNGFFESKLKVGATTRNWKTVLKLQEMSR